MPLVGSTSNNSSALRASVPYNSYAQLRAQKDQELKYITYEAEQARVDQQEQERKIQVQSETLAKLKALPFETPDKQRLRGWIKNKEKEAAARIQTDYNGDVQKFLKTEGQIWLQDVMGQMQGSDLYATAERNKEMVAMAKSAIAKDHNLIGKVDEKGRYVPAEQDMLSYYSGANPTFSFNGSYDPKTTVQDHFGKMDNPYGSKFDQQAFAQSNEVLGYLQSEKGEKAGLDLYMRSFSGKKIPFKRYSLEDQVLFNVDVANKKSQITTREMNAETARINALKAGKKDDEVTLPTGVNLITGNIIQTTPFESVTADTKQSVGNLGVSLSDMTVPGQDGKPVLEFAEVSNITLGSVYNKYAGLTKNSQIGKALVLNSGGKQLDFSKIPHEIVAISPNVFIDQAERNKATKEDRIPEREGKKVTIRVKRDWAVKNNLLSEGGWFSDDSLTENAKGARPIEEGDDNEYVTFDVMTFSKGFYKSPEVQQILNKSLYGQKSANDIQSQVIQAMDEYKSVYDDE